MRHRALQGTSSKAGPAAKTNRKKRPSAIPSGAHLRATTLSFALIFTGVMPPLEPLDSGARFSPGTSAEKSELLPADTMIVGRFSQAASGDSIPADWLPLIFGGDRGETVYRMARLEGRTCLSGEARGGGSGLVKPMVVDPEDYPRLLWSWLVPGPVPGGDIGRKEADDFAARIYVNFRFEPSKAGLLDRLKHRLAGDRFGGEAPGRSLVYVWGNVAPPGTVAPNAYTDDAMVIVVRSGEVGAGTWRAEERNILEDFNRAFGEEPPDITSIAIMSDADDTGAVASACYGDILLLGLGGGDPSRE